MRGDRWNSHDSGLPGVTSIAAALLLLFEMGCASTASQGAADQQERPPSDANTVTAEEIEDAARSASPEALLQGRIAGVHVSEAPGGGVSVQIRGANFIQGNNEPLYVIDGLPTAPGPGGELSGVSLYDIESIEVLKGTAAMAKYGNRGVNGVIVVMTKRPPEPGQ